MLLVPCWIENHPDEIEVCVLIGVFFEYSPRCHPYPCLTRRRINLSMMLPALR